MPVRTRPQRSHSVTRAVPSRTHVETLREAYGTLLPSPFKGVPSRADYPLLYELYADASLFLEANHSLLAEGVSLNRGCPSPSPQRVVVYSTTGRAQRPWGSLSTEMSHWWADFEGRSISYYASQDCLAEMLLRLSDASKLDEDEAAPIPDVIERASQFLRELHSLMRPLPPGSVSTFYGEINITWRADNNIVRIAFFPNRPSLLQLGNLSLPLGWYHSQSNPTGSGSGRTSSHALHIALRSYCYPLGRVPSTSARKSWFDGYVLTNKAYRLRPTDTDGLSVGSSHTAAKQLQSSGFAVAQLRIVELENLGLSVLPTDDNHANILGFPPYTRRSAGRSL